MPWLSHMPFTAYRARSPALARCLGDSLTPLTASNSMPRYLVAWDLLHGLPLERPLRLQLFSLVARRSSAWRKTTTLVLNRLTDMSYTELGKRVQLALRGGWVIGNQHNIQLVPFQRRVLGTICNLNQLSSSNQDCICFLSQSQGNLPSP